ncbi:cation:dicarboxylate symporter family transporter [Bifidobacterium catenulatum]|uniref:cation:dicarboxylate symporter family transporter n=1 Tax=Bifidobacterium catenulatum TaxID=1686 RepID=UPI003F9355AD
MLGVAAILFTVLSFLKRKKNAGFTTRVLLATVFGIILGIAFKGHTDYVGAVGSIWSNAITALVVSLLLFSIISSITNLGESIRLKNIGAKTVFFLLLNTATASLLTLILAQAFQLGRGFHYTLGQFTRNYTQTVKRAADNKRRYAPGWVHSTCLLRGFPKGAAPHLAHDFAEQSVVCYTLCRRCPENTVAAGEGKGI